MKNSRFQCIALIAAITLGIASSAGAAKVGGGHDGVAPGQWVIMTYVPDNGYEVPIPFHVLPIKGGGVSFDFLPTPDRAVLLTGVKPAKKASDSLTGKTISAHIAILGTTGATFNYCGPGCDGTDPGGFVRLYLQGTNPALNGCEPGWHPERPDCEAQYWWSNPIYIDLDALFAVGPDGVILTASLLNASLWSDRDGHLASQPAGDVCWSAAPTNCMYVDHGAAFAAAVANATKVGLSFGGEDNFAFGAGVTAPASATFQLLELHIE